MVSVERNWCNVELREQIADLAHGQWAGWMKHLFSKGNFNPDGSFTIEPESTTRWLIQVTTDYSDLSKDEKDSDRREADKFLAVFDEYLGQNDGD